MSTPDSFDKQLISLLGQDARQSSEALAKKLKVSSATVRRRLRKLTRNNLLHVVGVVDPANFGLPLAAVISLDVDHDKLDSAMDALVDRPEIKWVSTTTGRFDIVAMARFPSTSSLSDFLTDQLGKIDGIRDSETSVCLEIKKLRELLETKK